MRQSHTKKRPKFDRPLCLVFAHQPLFLTTAIVSHHSGDILIMNTQQRSVGTTTPHGFSTLGIESGSCQKIDSGICSMPLECCRNLPQFCTRRQVFHATMLGHVNKLADCARKDFDDTQHWQSEWFQQQAQIYQILTYALSIRTL